jgi:16S rRNA (cytosine967-C5)-methyltransferase
MLTLRKLSAEGQIYFQDEASQLVATLVNVQPNGRVLDVCASPGSKSTLIGALSPHAPIIAGDVYEHRVHTIKALAQQQGATNLYLVIHDATCGLPFVEASFDRVLVDAPCSGTGTLRHNPEIRWRLKSSDIAELAAKQKQILANAAAMVRPGGLLLYSTCSLETEENESVIGGFLREFSNFARMELKASAPLLTADGNVRTWPDSEDVDGFFMTALERRK